MDAHAKKSSIVIAMMVVPFSVVLINRLGSYLVWVHPLFVRKLVAPLQKILPPCFVP